MRQASSFKGLSLKHVFETYQDKLDFILNARVDCFTEKIPSLNPSSGIRKLERLISFLSNSLADNIFYFNRYKKLISARGVKQNKTLLLLGNGPSLSILNFDYIMKLRRSGDIDVFSINSFADDSRVADLQPDLYLVSSPLFFCSISELSTYNNHFHSKILRMREYLLSNSHHMTAFIPYSLLKKTKEFFFNDLTDVVAFHRLKPQP